MLNYAHPEDIKYPDSHISYSNVNLVTYQQARLNEALAHHRAKKSIEELVAHFLQHSSNTRR